MHRPNDRGVGRGASDGKSWVTDIDAPQKLTGVLGVVPEKGVMDHVY